MRFQLTLELERANRIYAHGEEVRGQVRVLVRQDTSCSGVSLEHSWSASQGSERLDLRAEGCEVSKGVMWKVGEEYSYPFALRLHTSPYSNDGDLRIEHVLEATARLGRGLEVFTRDHVVRTGFRVEANPKSQRRLKPIELRPADPYKNSYCGLAFFWDVAAWRS